MSDPESFKLIADRLESIARDCFDLSAKERLRRLAEELDPTKGESRMGFVEPPDRRV